MGCPFLPRGPTVAVITSERSPSSFTCLPGYGIQCAAGRFPGYKSFQHAIVFRNNQFNRYRTAARTACIATALSLIKITAQAQTTGDQGSTGIENATTAVTGYFKDGILLMYAIGAVSGIIGAVKVYQKWNAGEQDAMKTAASWFGSCIFLVVVATILKGFFNIT